jgi:hypothetical protein
MPPNIFGRGKLSRHFVLKGRQMVTSPFKCITWATRDECPFRDFWETAAQAKERTKIRNIERKL